MENLGWGGNESNDILYERELKYQDVAANREENGVGMKFIRRKSCFDTVDTVAMVAPP